MFAGRTHSALIELAPNEERLYRLPLMSNGPLFVNAFDAYITGKRFFPRGCASAWLRPAIAKGLRRSLGQIRPFSVSRRLTAMKAAKPSAD
jgi:hypothetical protein